jgi:signal transduction histidine kinase/ligand-binding sensor domain-containing protein
MKNVLYSSIALILLFPAPAPSQELPFTHYTTDSENNPLPSAEVHQVYQDRLGYVWFAVLSSGLVRYDGHTMTLYTTADGLEDLELWDVIEDKAGRLWVASDGGLVVSDRPLSDYLGGARIRFISKIGSTRLVDTTIRNNRMAVDRAGRVWVGTAGGGVVRYRTDEQETIAADTISTDIDGDGKDAQVRSIIARRNGSVWVGVTGGDLLVFDMDSTEPDIISGGATTTHVLYESPSGTLWGGSRGGVVWRLEERDGDRSIVRVNDELQSDVRSLHAESGDALWAASGSGVMRLNPQAPTEWVIYTRENGMLSDNTHQMMQDREGNLWFAQSGGVSKLRYNYRAFENLSAVSHRGEKPILPAPAVNAVITQPGGSVLSGVWAATTDGVVWIKGRGLAETVGSDQGLRHNWVNGLAIDSEDRLWMGTSGGISCLSPDVNVRLPQHRGKRRIDLFGNDGILADIRGTTIYACHNLPIEQDGRSGTTESIWFPGYLRLFCLIDDTWLVFKEASGLPVSVFSTVELDAEGRLLVGTKGRGLYRSKKPILRSGLDALETREYRYPAGDGGGVFGLEIMTSVFEEIWSPNSGAPSDQIQKIMWRNGALWVGTPQGLCVLEGEPLSMTSALTTQDGLRSSNAFAMDFSPTTGALWLGTNQGLAQIDPTTRKVTRTVTRQDGLIGNEVWYYGSVAVAEDGSLYFGTANGLARYWPDRDRPNATLPLVHLNDVSFAEDRSGNNEIAIEYAALSFANESLIRYKTRLVGYDKDWSPETPEHKIRYTNLSAFLFPKTYSFEVLASNNDDLWSRVPVQYGFAVQPAWWVTWWAFLLQGVLLVGVVYTLHRYRVQNLARQNKMLEQTVEERTMEIRSQSQELLEKNVTLEEKNEEIVRTQQQLIVQEKLASLGALTAGIAHEIKNPLNFVNNFAELSVELVEELREDIGKHKDELGSDTAEDIKGILGDLEQNVTRINEHGKRADSIVRGMLLHSRGQQGERQETDVNALLDEYVNLAYHGMRAQDSAFNVKIVKDYDKEMPKIDAIPQDLSRVFLNIVNNACYATNEKKQQAQNDYAPTLSLSTKDLGDKIEVRIRDNGKGIPEDIKEKIFNPFFTTKPTGKGTGLGLSLSYDIIVQEHKGELKVESEAGNFTEFVICLPKDAR